MATTNISIRSLVYASFVVASMIASRADGLAFTTTTYVDSECTEPILTSHLFGVLRFNENTATTLGSFNECSTDSFGGSITVCDESTGEYGVSSYADAECAEFVQESFTSQNCSAGRTTTTSMETVYSVTFECSNAEPSVISPNRVSYVVEEYNDDNCIDPTGNTEILSFGYDGSSCSNSGVNGSSWFLSACMADGSFISQFFAPDDDTCSSDVWIEGKTTVTFLTNSCGAIEIEGLYYSVISCTTDSATLLATSGTFAPFTPAPTALDLTPAPSTDNVDVTMPTIIITNAPSPVAKRDSVAPITGAPARTTIETSAPTASEEAVSFNTVAPATITLDTFSPATTEATVAPDNTGAPANSRVEAASGATRAKHASVTAGAVAVTCGLGLLIVAEKMRQ